MVFWNKQPMNSALHCLGRLGKRETGGFDHSCHSLAKCIDIHVILGKHYFQFSTPSRPILKQLLEVVGPRVIAFTGVWRF